MLPAIAHGCEGAARIEVGKAGVHVVEFQAIAAAQPGLAGCSVGALQLASKGVETALRVVDDGDGIFGPADRIEFVANLLHGPSSWFDTYSLNNAYVLSASGTPGKRVHDAPAAKHAGGRSRLERVAHHEEENLMIRLDQRRHRPGEEPDLWQWAKLTHADPKPAVAGFDLPDLRSAGSPVRLRLNFRGMSVFYAPHAAKDKKPAEHSVKVSINDTELQIVQWDGLDEHEADLVIPAALLRTTGNQLSLSVSRRATPWKPDESIVDIVMFNWFELRYGIEGNLDADASAFVSASADEPIVLRWAGPSPPVLFGEDDSLREGHAVGAGMFSYAPAEAGLTLHPLIPDRAQAPASIRAMAEPKWRAPAAGADYLIVSHASLIDSIKPLAEFHERRGLKVAVIDVQDAYDTFNHGITHPQAIRDLVRHAHRDWPAPKPRFLLLVGDASFDIRHDTYNDLAYAKFANNPVELAFPGHFAGIPGTQYDASSKRMAGRNLIPTWQFPSAEGQSASDNAYGIVNDEGFHPAIAVGRLPVVEPAEVKAIVDKTIGYMTTAQPGRWQRDVMFITDESDFFKTTSDQIADTIAKDGFVADKVYASRDEADNLAHQSAIKQGLNDGQRLVHFIGHGGRYIWRTGPPDIRKNHDLFTLEDVSALTNAGRLPMILSMTCYSAPFDNPTEDSIGERFLREADKGAVAVFAASWRNAPSADFSKRLVTELLTPGATIGEAIVRAKNGINDRTLVEMYNLLGDPAVILERPRVDATLALDEDRWTPGVYVALPQDGFDGEIFVDWLDESGQPAQRAHFAITGSRFRLAMPRTAGAKPIAGVRIFASSGSGHEDAAARLDFPRAEGTAARADDAPTATSGPAAALAPSGMLPAPIPGDAIRLGGFETDQARPLATAD